MRGGDAKDKQGVGVVPGVLACPFCGARETDRFEIDGRGFLVFACMFSPSVDLRRTDEEIAGLLSSEYGAQGSAYFRRTCDRLHRLVTRPPHDASGAQPSGSAEGYAGP